MRVLPIVPAHQINEDPDPTPEEEEEELEEKLRQREDPQRFFRQGIGPDGILRIPVRPGGSGTPTIKAPPIGGASEAPISPVEPEPNVEPSQVNRPDTPKPDLPLRPGNSPANTPPVTPTEPVPQAARPSGSGPAGAAPGVPVAPTTLESIEVPAGLKLEAQGSNAVERGNSLAEQVRKALDFDPAPQANKRGDRVPDGLVRDTETGEKIALEVKYLGPDERGLRDLDRMINFINDKDVAQARKYLQDFKGGLLWVVNNEELVYKYDYLFRRSGLSGFRIVCIPSQ